LYAPRSVGGLPIFGFCFLVAIGRP
jgi:hypothetical protein